MPSWTQLAAEWRKQPANQRDNWLWGELRTYLSEASKLLDSTNVLLYFSAFLQKPRVNPEFTQIMSEDINGLMAAFHKTDCSKGLVVIIHTPGGDSYAIETITEYIHSKFEKVTVIVPVMAMSAGTMFALSCDEIIISRAGQLGPIDTQIISSNRAFSVKEIIQQFDSAKAEIMKNPKAAHAWAPVLQAYGPALYRQALNLELHAKTTIKKWLKNKGKTTVAADKIIKEFHSTPRVHGQRISYADLQKHGLTTRLLEDNQKLQDVVMSVYHLATIFAGSSSTTKIIFNNSNNQGWLKQANELV